MANVPAQIEARVVAPDGIRETERNLGDPLAKSRHEREARLDVVEELVERRRLAIDDDRRADVDVNRPPLGQQRGHVRRREGGEMLVHYPPRAYSPAGPASPTAARSARYLFPVSESRPKPTAESEEAAWKRMEAATLEYRRREFRETTPGQRLEQAFELNELASELRAGFLRARR